MHFFNSSTPQLEYASLTLLYDFNNSTNSSKDGDDDNNSNNNNDDMKLIYGSVYHDTFHEITTVTSPLTTVSPSVMNSAICELHESLSSNKEGIINDTLGMKGERNNKIHASNVKSYVENIIISKENEEEDNCDDKNHDNDNYNDNYNDNHNEHAQKQLESEKEKESATEMESSSSSAAVPEMNDNEVNSPQNINENNKDDITNKHHEQRTSYFHSLCIQEEKAFSLSSSSQPSNNSSTLGLIQTGSKNIHGLTIHYKIITNPQIILHCFSILHPHIEMDTSSLSSSIQSLFFHDMAVVLCIGVSGGGGGGMNHVLYHSNSSIYGITNKMNDFELLLLKLASTNPTEKEEQQQHEIELLLMSILLDDESIKTNNDVEIEKGNLYSVYQQLQLHQQHHVPQQPQFKKLPSFSSSMNNGFSNNTKPTKFKLKKSIQNRRRKMKKFLSNFDQSSKNNTTFDEYNTNYDISDLAATAFLSQSTPSSEVTRIISDQMQILSLVEKSMNLTSYSKSAYNNRQGKHYNNTYSSAAAAGRGGGGVKSPMNVSGGSTKRRGRKYIGADLSGFDYVDRNTLQQQEHDTNSWSSKMDDKNITTTQQSSISSNYRNNRTSSLTHVGGSRRGHHRSSSGGSEITSTTATSSTIHQLSSDNSSVTTGTSSSSVISLSMSSSSSSSIPTLSGPTRDSSLSKKKVRRDKVRKAIEANNLSRAMKHAVSMENGGMGLSPQRNKVQNSSTRSGNNYSATQTNGGMSSGFDPFAIDEETEDYQSSNNGLPSDLSGVPTEQQQQSAGYSNNEFDIPGDPIMSPARSTIGDATQSSPNRSPYVPGSRKIFVNIALNEDLSCLYRESKLSSYSVEGSVQILLKSDSTAFVPFKVVMTDIHDHVELLNENAKYTNMVSKEGYTNEDELGTKFKFLVTLPKYDHFFEILKYKCKSTLIPVPLRVQIRAKTNNTLCHVALQISSNPSNQKDLSDFTIYMMIPDNVIGQSVTTVPVGGVYDEEKNSVIWCVSKLGSGEKFQLHAKLRLRKSVEKFGCIPSFPILVRCQSLYTHLSGIEVDCEDESNSFPADVKTKVARRFRVAHKERS